MPGEDDERRIGELEDHIKRKDERIAQLRDEVDELRDLITRLRDRSDEYDSNIEQWCEAFGSKRSIAARARRSHRLACCARPRMASTSSRPR
jgi:predicted RNase H-like nuclease (RuvC/YqgF family)